MWPQCSKTSKISLFQSGSIILWIGQNVIFGIFPVSRFRFTLMAPNFLYVGFEGRPLFFMLTPFHEYGPESVFSYKRRVEASFCGAL
ncbi:hypothetical protein B9Z55_027687 [Caenorhabditis nigoni]|uniref:Uncharacterized protein n=1 Tax=Caenorhabditis nigoni TaxID=1611254 RepID=A0A2G5SF98_9PELO|nr:hypothetical protein B9Z55_027687 [Caenorhabditis nigoni]